MNKKKPTRNPTQHQPIRERSLGSSRPVSGVKGSNPSQNDEFGIYENKRFMHACTTLVGAPVTIETVEGLIYEGLFRVFSPRLELTIDIAHLIDPNEPGRISEEDVSTTMVFPMHDVVRCSAIDTDLDYATKESFQTDAQISGSKSNGEIAMKQLEEWVPEGADDVDLHDLNSGDANGWKPEDMFAINEREYGVQSTYKSNLEGYTIQLDSNRNSDEYREREALAAELAREIEGSQSSRSGIEMENGDEEEAFSAVVRPRSDRSSAEHDREGKYIPPARRQNSNPSSGREPIRENRNTGPRHHNQHQGSGSPPASQDSRTPVQQTQRRNDRDYTTPPSTMSQHGNATSQHGSAISSNSAITPSSSHSVREQHGSAGHGHHHDDYGRSGGGGGNRSGDRRNNYGGREINRSEHDTPQQGRGMGSTRGPPSVSQGRMRSQVEHDLVEFGNKFNLATSPANVVTVSPDQTSPKLPHQQVSVGSLGRSPPLSGGSSPIVSAEQRQSVSPQQPGMASSPSGNFQRQKSETEQDMPGHPDSSSPPASASGATTPMSVAAAAKKSNLNPNAKEFVLNPNAKVFVPGAAGPVSMSPGRPPISATPPQRPMTPATPTMPVAYATNPHHLLGPGGVQHPQFIHYVPTSMTGPVFNTGPQGSPYPGYPQNSTLTVSQASIHQQQQQQAQQQQQLNQQRYRVGQNANQGPRNNINPGDVTSPNHVLAATGNPILTQMTAGSPSQPPSFMQFPPQTHPQFANMAAMMQANQGMLMRLPPGSMGHMMVSQSPSTPPTMTNMMDASGGHPNMTIAWMHPQQGQVPPPHMPGVPPPPPNSLGAPHLGQPPPQTAGGQQHPSSVANSAQVAAVQAAVAQQQQQQQQQQVNNGGGHTGHTPAPSPGPMMYNTSGPQSLPHQFSPAYPTGVFMMPHGSPHQVMQQTIISSQGQQVPPPHHMHQYMQHQMVPGQQNAPHSILVHPAMAAQHAANVAAQQAAVNQGQPQSGGPVPQ